MAIQVICNCGNSLSVGVELAGKKVRCKACEEVLKIPSVPLDESAEEAQRRASGLVEAARTRLGFWDISPEQIAEIEESGEIFRTLKVVAPAGGIVMKRVKSLEGMAVEPGMEIFHIADLSSLWLSVEVFEDQVAWIAQGTPAEVTFTYFPGETFRGQRAGELPDVTVGGGEFARVASPGDGIAQTGGGTRPVL